MADGNPLIQGLAASAGNVSQSPTRLRCDDPGDGTALYLFSGPRGDGLYAVAFGERGVGVRAYSYDSDGVQSITFDGGSAAGVRGMAFSPDSSSAGVVGTNPRSIGVSGAGGFAGVLGEASEPDAPGVQGIHRGGVMDGVGVFGFARTGVWGDGAIGVIGQSGRDFGIGVEGDAAGNGGIGVYGAAMGERGIGVYATAPGVDSAALQVNGRAVFSASGRVVVPAGSTNVTQAGVTLTASSVVLAVLQDDRPGVAVRAAVPNAAAGSITIFLTQAPAADTAVGWFALN